MSTAILHCGLCRSGTTMLYSMLRTTVTNYQCFDREMPGRKVADEDAVITKRPMDIFWSSKRQRILSIRDPRAVLTSKHWSAPDQYFCAADKAGRGLPGLIPQWRALRALDGVVVRYEGVVSDPASVQDRLGRALGLEYRGRFEDFWRHETPKELARALNGIRPVDTGHDWRDHMPRLREQFGRWPELHEVMRDLGYESDGGWLYDR